MNDFTQIVITHSKPVEVLTNPTTYPLIGKGLQGAVFKLSNDRCVKIYSKKKFCRREKRVFEQISGKSAILPEIFEVGENYIVIEYLNGPSLQEFLEKSGEMSEAIAIQIIYLIKELKSLKFMRIDFSLRHSIYDKHGKLKIIDHVNSFKVQRAVPKRLFKDLKKLGLLVSFLEHVKKLEPDFYEEWRVSKKI